MEDYARKCANRLDELVKLKIDEFQEKIDTENQRIRELNKKNKDHAKAAGNSTSMITMYKKKDNYTQTMLVEDINHATGLYLSQQMLHLYCIGKSYPPIPTLIKLAEYFNVSFEYLAGVSDIPNLENSTAQAIINLDDNAINTLLFLTKSPETRDSLNALLSDKYYLVHAMNAITSYIYQKQLLEARRNAYLDHERYIERYNQLNLARFSELSSLNDYWVQQLSPLCQYYEEDIKKQIEEDLYKLNHYDEYSSDIATIEQPEDIKINIQRVTPVIPKDSQ